MTTKLIIARHGNTFTPEQTPTRVGARTDLPLVETGEDQALRLGHHLKAQKMIPDVVFTSNLRRTIDTARLACLAMGCHAPSTPLPFLNEIDYGIDENKPEPDVIARVGADNLKRWDDLGEMPAEWSPRPKTIISAWTNFLNRCAETYPEQTVMVVTSNGIARFALNCVQIPEGTPHKLKLSTGAYGTLDFGTGWSLGNWNIKP